MLGYVARRIIISIPTLLIISVLNFIIFNAPPGDFATYRIQQIEDQFVRQGGSLSSDEMKQMVADLRNRYGLDRPLHIKYLKWIWAFVRADLGESFEFFVGSGDDRHEVRLIIKDRLRYTLLLALLSLVFVHVISIPIALWVSTHQYKMSDYVFTFIGLIGLATPNFLLALIFLWIIYENTGVVMMGLFSDEHLGPGWSLGKLVDLIKHLIIPVVIIGTAGTAGTIRVLRATMLDELGAEYVRFERAKGLREITTVRHAFRVASNPMVAGIGSVLPGLMSAGLATSIVIGLPTLEPLFFRASMAQDIYLASSYLMIVTMLLVIGNILGDIMLAWLDPRIRFT
jgi:peptide/nickel transport system permease protein